MSKSRLVPIKQAKLKVSKLKLQAAYLAVPLKLAISDLLQFPVLTVTLWSNSQIIIKYICNTSKKFSVFIINKLHEI